MKTIHESILEMLDLIQQLDENGIAVQILYKPQELLDVPEDITESLAKVYLPMILEFYQNEDNMSNGKKLKKKLKSRQHKKKQTDGF